MAATRAFGRLAGEIKHSGTVSGRRPGQRRDAVRHARPRDSVARCALCNVVVASAVDPARRYCDWTHPMTTKGARVTPEQLQALVARLTARAYNEYDTAKLPGSPSARRFET